MSCSIALRRSPKPGALTASTLRMPRSLLTTSVASASPSTSSAMMTMLRLPDLGQLLQHRQDVGDRADLLVGDQHIRVLNDGLHAVGVGDEVGGDVALVQLHPLDILGLEVDAAALLDGDDPIAADPLHHVGDQLANLGVGGGDGRDLGDLLGAFDRGGATCGCTPRSPPPPARCPRAAAWDWHRRPGSSGPR